jgi:hypothetical protein
LKNIAKNNIIFYMSVTSPQNPFEAYRPMIFTAAYELYHAAKENRDPNPDLSRINMIRHLGSMTVEQQNEALRLEALVNAAARTAENLAILQDRRERGGILGMLAGVEIKLSKIGDYKFAKYALEPGGVVDAIRGRA